MSRRGCDRTVPVLDGALNPWGTRLDAKKAAFRLFAVGSWRGRQVVDVGLA